MVSSRSMMWIAAGGLLLGCGDPPAEDLLQTVTPQAQTTTPNPTPTPTPVPGSDFRIHPASLSLPMGDRGTLIAANFGVPIDHQALSWSQFPEGAEYGQYVPEFGVFTAPMGDSPPREPIRLTARWVDLFGRTLEASATITLTAWGARETGGPGSSCGGCPSAHLPGPEGKLIVMRSPHGVWSVDPDILPAIPVAQDGSAGPDCETPPIDPMEGTPPGNPLETPSPEPSTQEPTPLATPSPLLTPTPQGTPTADGPSPSGTPGEDPFLGRTFYDGFGTWTRLGNAPPITGSDLQFFSIPKEDAGFMALGDETLWRSPDGGQSWVEQDVPGRPITLAFFPESNEDILIPTRIETVFYMARTKNGGQTYSAWASSIDAPIERLAVVPRLTTRVIASTGDTLWLSEDDARTFTPVVEGLDAVHSLGAFLLGGAYAIVEVEGARQLLESTTAGEAWSTYEGIPGCAPLNLAVHPRNPSQMWITCVGGRILESYNGGEDFQPSQAQLPIEVPETAMVTLIPEDFPIAVVEEGEESLYFFFASQDEGWVPIGPGPGPRLTTMTSGLLKRPDLSGDAPTLTAFPALQVANASGWIETSVSPLGAYWISRLGPSLPGGGGPRSLSLGKDGDRAYAFDGMGALWGAYPGEEPYAPLPSPMGTAGDRITTLPGAPSSLLAINSDGSLHQFRHTEADAVPQSPEDWRALRGEGVLEAWGDPRDPDTLYALGDGGYLRSRDGGDSFDESVPSALGDLAPRGLRVNDEEVLLATDGGLFYADDGEAFRDLSIGDGAIGAMCRLPPRTSDTLTPDVPEGTGGHMAVVEGQGLKVRLEGIGGALPLGLLESAKHPDGTPGTIRQLEPSGAFPGGAWAWVDGLGLYVIYPAPIEGALPEPGQPLGEAGEPPVCP